MGETKYNQMKEPLLITKSNYKTRHGSQFFYEILNANGRLCFTILFESLEQAEEYLKEHYKNKDYEIDPMLTDEKEVVKK